MANLRRRMPALQDQSLIELVRAAPTGIHWKRDSWIASRLHPETGSKETRGFSAKTIGYAQALRHAVDWRDGEPVPPRHHARACKPAHARKLALSCRTLRGKWNAIYELSIQPGKAEGKPTWMRITLGSPGTITQQRIDDAVATLVARLERYSSLLKIDRDRASLEAAAIAIEHAPMQSRLRLDDVLAWNGKGDLVSYFPKPAG